MMRRRFVTVDVFTERPFGGNPLAVVLDAEGLTAAQMQAVAREFNYSETTFVLPPRSPDHDAWVRIFTPGSELPFAGHPNVGTAFVLGRLDSAGAGERLVFEEAAGLMPVDLLREGGTVVGAELTAPERLQRRDAMAAADIAACFSLAVDDVATMAHGPVTASVGLAFVIVALSSRGALARMQTDRAAFRRHLPCSGANAVFAYVRDGNDVQARMFAPLSGIDEDPATGSATCALVALLADLAPEPVLDLRLRVEQGVDMGRPSLLLARARKEAGQVVEVKVGGRCVPMLEGTFHLAGEVAN